jgi:hypothetical protein
VRYAALAVSSRAADAVSTTGQTLNQTTGVREPVTAVRAAIASLGENERTNTITQSGGGGLGGSVVAVGGAAAMIGFALTVGALIGGAVALAITVLSSTAAGCLVLTVGTRRVLEVFHWKKYGQLPPPRPMLTVNRPMIEAPGPRPVPRMTVSRADYIDT